MNNKSDRLSLAIIFALAGLLLGVPIILAILTESQFININPPDISAQITSGPLAVTISEELATFFSGTLTGTQLATTLTPHISDADQTATVLATRTPPPPTHTPTPIPTRVIGYWTATAAARLTQVAQTSPTAIPGCFFNWATQDLPELTAEVQAALDDAGLDNVTVRAFAFGENCISNASNEVEYFAAMQTDFHVTAQVANLDDETALGDLAAQILVILNAIPAEDKPGPMSGQITLTFTQGSQQIVLRVSTQQAAALMGQGVSGAELWAAIMNLQ